MLLNCHTYHSHTYGTYALKELIDDAAAHGYDTLGLTDINNTAVNFDFYKGCKEAGIRPLTGIDFRNMDEGAAMCYVGLAKTNRGWYELNKHLTEHLHEKKTFGTRAPDLEDVAIVYPFQPALLKQLKPNEYMGIRPHELNRLIMMDTELLRKKAVALYPVSFKQKDDFYLHCLLRAIDKNTLLSKLERKDAGERNEYMVSPKELEEVYKPYPFLLTNARKLADECRVEFDLENQKNKKDITGSAENDMRVLREACLKGLEWRYKGDTAEARSRLETEFNVIQQSKYVAYFLMAWDVVQYGKSQGYFHAGRGSGANSVAAYCLGITEVDPIELNLYFERFLNMHRSSPPDFDIDFSWKDREDVTEYIFKKYGNEHTALLGSHSTFQFRAVARELGKVYGLPKAEIDRFISVSELEARTKPVSSINDRNKYLNKILHFGKRLTDFPNHHSVHSSGIVISHEPILHYGATHMPPKGFQATQFDMYTADGIKLYKLDLLSQRGLGHIKDSIQLVKDNQGVEINIHETRKFMKDPKLNALLAEGNTIGCFYIESPAMRQLLRKLSCDNFLTLVAASSVIRPGVSDSGMGRMFVERHRNPELMEKLPKIVKEVLGETYGVMVYQEDVIRMAHKFGGLTLAEADILRRNMAWKFRLEDGFLSSQEKFFANCREKAKEDPEYTDELINEIWRQMVGFAGFSFCKAHSASYAVESYQSLFLKAYYPLEFMVAVVNNFGGYYNTEFYINEARRWGGQIHAPCINRSDYLTNIEGVDIHLGFIHIKNLEQKTAELIPEERRRNGDYLGLYDFCSRLNPSLEQLIILIKIGALRFTGYTKKQLLWKAHLLYADKKRGPKKDILFPEVVKEYHIPPMRQSTREDASQEIELLSFPVCSRFELLIDSFRGEIKAKDMVNNLGKKVTMVGYLTNTKTNKTSKGDYMQFGSFIDDEGDTFEGVLFPQVYRRMPFTSKSILKLMGKITIDYDVPVLEVNYWELMAISFKNEDVNKGRMINKAEVYMSLRGMH